MIKNAFLYLKIIILIIIIVINNNVNSQTIDIYFSNSYGDLNGNGTISNPYQNLCLLNQILNSNNNNNNNNDNSINNSIIIINIDYGDYNLNCSSFLIINNFNNISFIPYKSNDNNSNNNNNNNDEIVNLNNITTLKIFNSNLRFDGLITIITNQIEISYSRIIFNNGSKLYFNIERYEHSTHFQCSNITFSNSTFLLKRDEGYLVSESSSFEFLDSSLENISLIFNNNLYCNKSNNNNNSIGNSSSSSNSSYFLSMFNCNATLIYFRMNGFGNVLINNSLLNDISIRIEGSFIVNINSSNIYATSLDPLFIMANMDIERSLLNIINSNIYYLNDSEYPLAIIVKNSLLNISGCNINGNFKRIYPQALINVVGTPSSSSSSNGSSSSSCIDNEALLILENSKISNFNSPNKFIFSICSTIFINNIKFFSNSYSTFLYINSSSNVNLDNIIMKCDDMNRFEYLFLALPPSSSSSLSSPSSNITISNVYMSCVGMLEFENCRIEISNFSLESFSKPSTIRLSHSSELIIRNGVFISSIFKIKSFMFYLEQNSRLVIINCQFIDSTTNIIFSRNSETVLQNSNFSNIIPHGGGDDTFNSNSIFYFSKSILQIENCNFNQTQTLSSLFYMDFSENVIIKSTRFERVGDTIFKSYFSNNNIIIDDINVVNCSTTQSELFFLTFSENVVIGNSTFGNNHGIGYNLFTINGCSHFEISKTMISDNSFSSIFKESNSNAILLNSIISNGNTVDDFYKSSNCSSLSIDTFNFTNNYVNSIFTINKITSKIQLSNIIITNNYFTKIISKFNQSIIEINNLTFIDNILIAPQKYDLDGGGSGSGGGLFFENCQVISKGLQILNNEISVNLINLNDTILLISDGLFENNQISSNFIHSDFSTVALFNTKVLHNQGGDVCSTLFVIHNSNINISDCEFSFNNLYKNGMGSIINFNKYLNKFTYFQIENSLFSFNIAKFGQLYFSGYLNDQDAFTNSNSTFSNKTLISNHASSQGGAIFTENFIFSLNISNILNSNHFDNNTSLCGDNFSSSLKEIIFIETNDTFLVNGVGTIINYNAVDFYNNVFTTLSSPIQISITSLSNNETLIFTEMIIGGKGSFLHTFIGPLYERFKIELNSIPYYSNVYLTLGGCLPFQYMNNLTCEYCPIGSSYSNSIGQCLKCNPNAVTCVGSFVNVNTGYYMIDNEISMVERCANDMCLSNNQCQFKYSSGDLCFSCLDPDSSTPTFIAAKHGINCCSQFKLWLIVPLLLLYLVSALVLSVIKLNLFTTVIGPIIVFLQINSVVFFSYNGIYILSFFRVSLDILNGICIFKGLNHGDKTLIILLIIIMMFLISSSDWFPLWLFRKLNSNFKLHNYLKRNLKKNRNLKKSSSTTQLNYFIRSRWQLFQIFIIPLIFNSFTLIIPKKIKDQTLLLVDFSILFNSWQSIIQIFISVLVIISVIVFLILKYQFYSKGKLKLWSFIIILRSVLFSILSITSIFSDNEFYMPSIILIQIVYSSIYLYLKPLKEKIDNSNFINLIQLIIFLVADSRLFQPISPHYLGLILTLLIIILNLFIIIKTF
ncbi:hypothetical protein ACTFIW_002090 [Dictyostelium discoideum]